MTKLTFLAVHLGTIECRSPSRTLAYDTIACVSASLIVIASITIASLVFIFPTIGSIDDEVLHVSSAHIDIATGCIAYVDRIPSSKYIDVTGNVCK